MNITLDEWIDLGLNVSTWHRLQKLDRITFTIRKYNIGFSYSIDADGWERHRPLTFEVGHYYDYKSAKETAAILILHGVKFINDPYL